MKKASELLLESATPFDNACMIVIKMEKVRDIWETAALSSYKWKAFTAELKRIIEDRRGVILKKADIFRYITDNDILKAEKCLDK